MDCCVEWLFNMAQLKVSGKNPAERGCRYNGRKVRVSISLKEQLGTTIVGMEMGKACWGAVRPSGSQVAKSAQGDVYTAVHTGSG